MDPTSPTSTISLMSPMMGKMSPMMGMSSPMMDHALPEMAECFYAPDDENPLELNFMTFPTLMTEDDEDEQTDEHKTNYVEKDGISWVVTRGRPPTMAQLEDQLAEVKSLYKTKFGEDFDEEEDEEDEQADEDDTNYVEKDGISWVVTRGRPPTMSQLEDQLAEVKSLYKTKYGEDMDDEEDEQANEHETKYVE